MSEPWTPNWCIAPAAVLEEWMQEHGVTTGMLASRYAVRQGWAAEQIIEVLTRQPLAEDHAAVLAVGTGVSERFWLALEHNYRAGLAAGLPDVTA